MSLGFGLRFLLYPKICLGSTGNGLVGAGVLDQAGEVGCQGGLGGLEVGTRVAEEGLHAGDGAAGEAAGDDEVEVGEVGGDVESQAVGGDPLADADAHGGDLGGLGRARTCARALFLTWNPDACGFGVALALDAIGGEGVDDGLFQQSHVVVEAEGFAGVGVGESLEVEDGVGDDLAGAVVGDVAAAVGLVESDAQGSEALGIGQDVVGGTLAAGDGDDGWVLDEVDGAEVALGVASCLDELILAGPLDGEGVLIAHAAEIGGFQPRRMLAHG